MQVPGTCSTLSAPTLHACAQTRGLGRSRLHITRLLPGSRVHVVSKANRRNRQPSYQTPPSVIEFLAEDTSVEDSDEEEFWPSSLPADDPYEYDQGDWINDYVNQQVEREKEQRQRARDERPLDSLYPREGATDWTDEQFVDFPHGTFDTDISDPEPYIEHDWEPNELRAWIEKRRFYAKEAAEWGRAAINRGIVGQVSEFNDVRLMPKDGEPAKRWTHQETWDLITDSGYNYNPSDHIGTVFKPDIKCDYFSEGCVYKEECVDMLDRTGRLWDVDVDPGQVNAVTVPGGADAVDLDKDEQDDLDRVEGPPAADQVASLETVRESEQEEFEKEDDV